MKKTFRGASGVAIKCVAVFGMVLPFYLALCYAVKSKMQIASTGLAFPTGVHWENFEKAIQRSNFAQTSLNTLLCTTVGTIILLAICSMAAYVVGRRRCWLFKLFNGMLVLTILVPFHAYMFPLYVSMREWGIVKSMPLVAFLLAKVGAQVGFSTVVMTGFVKFVPLEIEEAARIDGCSEFGTFLHVVVPLMQPILMTSVVINALSIWNEYAMGVVFLPRKEYMTLPMMQFNFFGEHTSDLGQAFALFSLSMLPILALYLLLQRYVISGIALGAVKG